MMNIENKLEELVEEQRGLRAERSAKIEQAERQYTEKTVVAVRGMDTVHNWVLCADSEQKKLAREISEIYDEYSRKIAVLEEEEADLLDEME